MDLTETQETQETHETHETHETIENPTELAEPDNSVDDLTLQLLLNSKNYHKVMKIKEPKKYNNDFQKIVLDNKEDILDVTKDMVSGVTDDYSVDIYQAFQNYVKMIFKHREMQDIQQQNEFNRDEYEEEQIEKLNHDYVQKSFWSGERVIKRL